MNTAKNNEYATTAFLRDAFVDYLAARVLLLADLPEQGSILCSTAIEKCAKAVIKLGGDEPDKQHLSADHWRVLESDSKFGHLLNGEFVQLSRKAYKLRYTKDLPLEYNLVIASREFLAEMDHTLQTILSCFKYHINDARRLSGYEGALTRSDQRLIAENHLITGEAVKQFVSSRPQAVYEVRRTARGFLEARYRTDREAKRPGFLRTGLLPLGKTQTDSDLSHFPMRGTLSLVVDGIERIGQEATFEPQ
jgi:hypothetical protein